MSVHEVGTLLGAKNFRSHKEIFLKNEVDGQFLMECNTVEDLIEIGILLKPKAKVLLKMIEQWKKTGVRIEDLSDNEDTHQDDR